jgi:hypothetical protein
MSIEVQSRVIVDGRVLFDHFFRHFAFPSDRYAFVTYGIWNGRVRSGVDQQDQRWKAPQALPDDRRPENRA